MISVGKRFAKSAILFCCSPRVEVPDNERRRSRNRTEQNFREEVWRSRSTHSLFLSLLGGTRVAPSRFTCDDRCAPTATITTSFLMFLQIPGRTAAASSLCSSFLSGWLLCVSVCGHKEVLGPSKLSLPTEN